MKKSLLFKNQFEYDQKLKYYYCNFRNIDKNNYFLKKLLEDKKKSKSGKLLRKKTY